MHAGGKHIPPMRVPLPPKQAPKAIAHVSGPSGRFSAPLSIKTSQLTWAISIALELRQNDCFNLPERA